MKNTRLKSKHFNILGRRIHAKLRRFFSPNFKRNVLHNLQEEGFVPHFEAGLKKTKAIVRVC